MNSYLVRIYRKADNNPRLLVGVVEEVGAKDKKAFNSVYELWDILNPEKGKQVNPVRNSSGALNSTGIILKSNPSAEQRGIISNGVKRRKTQVSSSDDGKRKKG